MSPPHRVSGTDDYTDPIALRASVAAESYRQPQAGEERGLPLLGPWRSPTELRGVLSVHALFAQPCD